MEAGVAEEAPELEFGLVDVLSVTASGALEGIDASGTLADDVGDTAAALVGWADDKRVSAAALSCTSEPAVASCNGAETGVVVTMDSDVVVGSAAAAAVARLPVKVVRDRGMAVHRWPSIVVIENPAGRVALVDMVKMKSDTSRCRQCTG